MPFRKSSSSPLSSGVVSPAQKLISRGSEHEGSCQQPLEVSPVQEQCRRPCADFLDEDEPNSVLTWRCTAGGGTECTGWVSGNFRLQEGTELAQCKTEMQALQGHSPVVPQRMALDKQAQGIHEELGGRAAHACPWNRARAKRAKG